MDVENIKIFKVHGEYKMSEDDSFKTAKNIALDLAEENLDTEVESFLRENFPNLDDIDIVDIEVKFLQKSEPRFIRENLHGDEMICYAELDAEINLTALNKFMENFAVFKLEKKVLELENKNSTLENKVSELEDKVSELTKILEKLEGNSSSKINISSGNGEMQKVVSFILGEG